MPRFRCIFPTLLLASLTVAPALAQTPVSSNTLMEHTPRQVLDGTATRVSHYNPEQKLRLALAVQDSHMAEEDQFIKELTTKSSPNFHKFITQDEWNARFAPAAEDEQKVVDWAQSVGLTVTYRYPNRLLVDVEAPAGVIEKAFGVTINNYQVGDEVDFSNDRDPAIPANLSGILHAVAGLNNIERVRRLGTSKRTVKGPDYAAGPVIAAGEHLMGAGDPAKASASPAPAPKVGESASSSTPRDSYGLGCIGSTCAMDPDNIWSSEGYNYNALQRFSHCCNVHNDSTGSPSVTSIALVGYGAFNDSDVEEFFNFYGLAWNINVWWVDGSSPAVDGEAPLDVEYSGAMSNNPGTPNNTAHIYEYEMADGSLGTYEDAFAQIVSQDHAKVVSTSYGGTENLSGPWNTAETGALHTTFNNMLAEGYTLIAASGDNGASDGCGDAYDVDYPSSDPDFIAAGGTQLTLNGSGIYQSEIGWQGEFWTSLPGLTGGACDNNHGGSTGGVSALFTAPWWQNSSSTTIDLLSPTYLWKGGDADNPVGSEYYYTGNTKRLLPDMALTANPDVQGEWYYSTCCNGGGWQDEGGTSIVAPELAGFFAQENTYLNYIGNICGSGTDACTPVGLASPFLYENGANNTHHNPFYDMLSGCSDNDVTVANDLYYYCAFPGFDLVTGWGSANMMQLAWGINWQLIPAYSIPVITFNDKPAINTWYNTDQEVSWTVTDGLSQGSGTPSGVAGFTQGWDSIPSDPYSEPHSGEGNSFYSGPEYAFGKNGCLSLNGGFGCSGNGGAQGCHTVQLEAWDNQGGTAYGSYGPLCYDTVVPTISINPSVAVSNTGWFNSTTGVPNISFAATDPGGADASGVKIIYGVLGPTTCLPSNLGTCQVYGGPFPLPQGSNPITAFSEDKAGNFSIVDNPTFYVDTVAPATAISLVGSWNNGTSLSAVTVHLTATDATSGVKTTYYTLDGGSNTVYLAPFVVSPAGSHTLKYWSVDNAGNTETTNTNTFAISSPTTATLVATPNPSLLGNSVKMTATITATLSGSATPTGSVTFWNGATNLGTSTLSGGVATLSTTTLPAGMLTLQASYLGATYYQTTNSAPFDQTVDQAAALTSPTPSSTLTGSSATFTWTAGTGVTKYQFRVGTTAPGSSNIYNPSDVSTTALTTGLVTNIPTIGQTLYARLYSYINGAWQYNDYTYTESDAGARGVLTSPAPGGTLTGSSATFTWTAGTNVTKYQFRVGTTGAGSSNIYNPSGASTTDLTTGLVTNIPTTGQKLYARLYSYIGGAWQYNDYTYTESDAGARGVLTSPTPGSTLTGSSATFTWTAGTNVTKYQFQVGTTGAGSSDIYNPSAASTTTLTTGLVTNIPTTGQKLYARLSSYIAGAWQYNDYTYTESDAGARGVLTSPTPGSTLTGSSATFTWTAGTNVTKYQFRVGTTGAGSSDVYNPSGDSTTTLTTGLVTNIPTTGQTLYARLYSYIGGAWQYNDYTYTESDAGARGVLTSPTPGSTLTGASATFTWTAGTNVTKYQFRVGTTGAGSSDVYNPSGASTTALTTGLVSNIPITGQKLYARLYSYIGGAWQYNDYTYTEFGTPASAALTSPTPGNTLTGSTATFTWTASTNVTKYQFRVGTTGPGSNNVYNAAEANTAALTTGLVSNIPAGSGAPLERLYSYINGAWQYNEYT